MRKQSSLCSESGSSLLKNSKCKAQIMNTGKRTDLLCSEVIATQWRFSLAAWRSHEPITSY
jgi:hypothetical protein